MIHYQLLVKAISLKQIMANHAFYFWPVLNAWTRLFLAPYLSFMSLLSLPVCIPFLLCAQARGFFILIPKIQIFSEEVRAHLVST